MLRKLKPLVKTTISNRDLAVAFELAKGGRQGQQRLCLDSYRQLVSKEVLAHMFNVCGMKEIQLTSSDLPESEIQTILNISKGLTFLDFNGCSNFDNDCLKLVTNHAKTLRSLSIAGCRKISGCGLAELLTCKDSCFWISANARKLDNFCTIFRPNPIATF